jgi:prevent-host-death family protein
MQTVKASVFKAKCLHLMDFVNESGEEIVITKHGKPVSRLVPYRKQVDSLFGLHKDVVKSSEHLLEPVGDEWDVEK